MTTYKITLDEQEYYIKAETPEEAYQQAMDKFNGNPQVTELEVF